MVKRLSTMDYVMAERLPKSHLLQMRMPKNQCHANSQWYAEQDSNAEAVTGWLIQWPDYVVHSLVKVDGEYRCVTPVDHADEAFPFVPDASIEWVDNGDVKIPTHKGMSIGIGVRRFPEFTLARTTIVRNRILAGTHPYEAMQFSNEEMNRLKVEHIPLEEQQDL